MFGIPMFGVDTCGFAENSNEELCNRWMQLSAFFPFYCNHNTLGTNSQEPYVWPSVAEATRSAMEIRFRLLPYMYTLFYNAHTRGDTVMRALAWEHPNDPSLRDADRQFFLGPAILLTPVLNQGETSVNGVFPGLVEGTAVYYDWYNQSAVPMPRMKNTTIDAPLGHIPVYIKGGNIIAMQEPAMTTREARKTDWSILIAFDAQGCANGSLYLDDGESIVPNATKLVSLKARKLKSDRTSGFIRADLYLEVSVEGTFTELDLPLANITVLGIEKTSDQKVMIDGKSTNASAEYSAEKKHVVVSRLHEALGGKAWVRNWTMTF